MDTTITLLQSTEVPETETDSGLPLGGIIGIGIAAFIVFLCFCCSCVKAVRDRRAIKRRRKESREKRAKTAEQGFEESATEVKPVAITNGRHNGTKNGVTPLQNGGSCATGTNGIATAAVHHENEVKSVDEVEVANGHASGGEGNKESDKEGHESGVDNPAFAGSSALKDEWNP